MTFAKVRSGEGLPLLVTSVVGRLDPAGLDLYTQSGFRLNLQYHLSGSRDEDRVIEAAAGSWGVLAGTEVYGRRVFEALPELRAIARCGVGFDAIDVEAATDHGVTVITTPGTNDESVAEFALGLILALTVGHPHTPTPLTGRSVAIVGFGAIGRAVARRLSGFDCHIMAVDPLLDASTGVSSDVEVSSLQDALSRADVVTVHAPLTSATRGLLGWKEFEMMRESAVLVNTSRGGLVDEDALTAALNQGNIKGAALDVFEEEPLARDHPLRSTPNTLLSGHLAGASLSSVAEMLKAALGGLIDAAEGRSQVRGALNNVEAKLAPEQNSGVA